MGNSTVLIEKRYFNFGIGVVYFLKYFDCSCYESQQLFLELALIAHHEVAVTLKQEHPGTKLVEQGTVRKL